MTNTENGFWGSYAMGLLEDVQVGEDIVAYVEAIDATLAPFGGRFLVHGGEGEQVEGASAGAVVVIGFPARDGAAGWYRSAAYQAVVGLRARNSHSRVVLLPGVGADHLATDVLAELLPAVPGR